MNQIRLDWMQYNCFNSRLFSFSHSAFNDMKIPIPLASLLFSPFLLHHVHASESWTYLQANDPSTNRSYSIARSPLPRRDLYDVLRLEIYCKDNKLQAVIDSDILIASQGSNFDFEYQVDASPLVKLQMRTFPDSKRKGYTDDQAKSIADAVLSGQSIFIRVNTMIRRVLSGAISLNGATEPVQHVLNDCGNASAIPLPVEQPYTLTEFEQALGKLPPDQQRQILQEIRKLLPKP